MKFSDIEFDSPFIVTESGLRDDATRAYYAPDLTDGEVLDSTWEIFSDGYTGQQGGGSIMHNSEQLSGQLLQDIMATPGVYAIVPCYWSPDEDGDDSEVEGWAVVRHV